MRRVNALVGVKIGMTFHYPANSKQLPDHAKESNGLFSSLSEPLQLNVRLMELLSLFGLPGAMSTRHAKSKRLEEWTAERRKRAKFHGRAGSLGLKATTMGTESESLHHAINHVMRP